MLLNVTRSETAKNPTIHYRVVEMQILMKTHYVTIIDKNNTQSLSQFSAIIRHTVNVYLLLLLYTAILS